MSDFCDHYTKMDSCDGTARRIPAENRKSNKPLLEKRRRARINQSLDQLKSLLMDVIRNDTTASYTKLEKADILEMAVKHLRQVQRRQLAVAGGVDPAVMLRYETGFSECANEVSRYLSSIDGLLPDLRLRLMNHLAECITARANSNNSRIAVHDSLPPPPSSLGEIVRLPTVTSQLLPTARDSSSLLPVLLSHNSQLQEERREETWNGSDDVNAYFQPIRNVRTTQTASDWSVLRAISTNDKWRQLANNSNNNNSSNNNNDENIAPCANSHGVRIKRRGRRSCSRNCSLSSDVVREEGSDPTTSGQTGVTGVKDEPVWRPW